jgi:hypothetical protein
MGCVIGAAMTLALAIFTILSVSVCTDGEGTTVESYP